MQTLIQNLRFSLRMLGRNPGLTITILLTVALGIGANTAIFTVDYATLLAPLPFPQPNQLVMVWQTIQGNRNGVAAGDYTDWKQQRRLLGSQCVERDQLQHRHERSTGVSPGAPSHAGPGADGGRAALHGALLFA